ncbi:TRAP transporter small permease [Skermanella rosea]|uniref:TRAP transporter small permease n=1 Tax=Skermanella rosea TaxID=1817965 RepID=UPI0019334BBF|nr:TRAP transporter small permease [Skermanella rosea]UEM01827.1 TRAP transporter small permease [Skermanella rosea]
MENDLDEGGSAEPLPLPFRIIETLFGSILALLFITLICTVGANVAGRFLFNYSLAWADELSRFIFIWLIFLGAALAYLRSEHIAVDYVEQKLTSTRARAAMRLLQDLLVLFVLAMFLWGAWQVLSTYTGHSALLQVPMSWINASVPVAVVIMALMCFYHIARHLRGLTSKDDPGLAPDEGRSGDAQFVKVYRGE